MTRLLTLIKGRRTFLVLSRDGTDLRSGYSKDLSDLIHNDNTLLILPGVADETPHPIQRSTYFFLYYLGTGLTFFPAIEVIKDLSLISYTTIAVLNTRFST